MIRFAGFIKQTFLPIVFVLTIAASCNSNYTYKKRGYYKIPLPAKEYVQFDRPGYPYTFQYPKYAQILKDTSFFGDAPENPWWINIDMPQLNGRIYISYKDLKKYRIDTLVAQSFKMAYLKHTEIATGIDDSLIKTSNGANGMYFSLHGNTATANQFFLTDSSNHFLRGALYFDAAPNEDSLSVLNSFLKQDLLHLINTLKWK